MKVIIAGSRDVTDYKLLCKVIRESGFKIDEIVSGHARGIDELGERYAKNNAIDLTIMPANWQKYGKSAGYRRNAKMADYVGRDGGLIAIRKNNSTGTGHMIDIAFARKIPVFVHEIND